MTPTSAALFSGLYCTFMRYLGIDYGAKRVGVAVSDAEGTIAFPRDTLDNNASLLEGLAGLVAKEGIEAIVVGDTRSHGGAKNPVTAEAENFMKKLEERTEKRVLSTFEAFSSIEASRYAPEGKEHEDSAAAAIILQRYLDMKSPEHRNQNTNKD